MGGIKNPIKHVKTGIVSGNIGQWANFTADNILQKTTTLAALGVTLACNTLSPAWG